MIKNYKNIHNYDVYSVDISKDNSKFISGGGDKNIVLTDVIEAKFIRKYTGHTARINSVCFNPENNVIVQQFTFRLARATILQCVAGTIGVIPTIPSKSSKGSKIQSHRSNVWALVSFARVWMVMSNFLISAKEKLLLTLSLSQCKDLALLIAERLMWLPLLTINFSTFLLNSQSHLKGNWDQNSVVFWTLDRPVYR